MDELTTKETILFDGLSGDAFTRILDGERPEEVLESAIPFIELMSRYRCAMM